jgi:hypothetical protein
LSTTFSATHPGLPQEAAPSQPTHSNPEGLVREAFDDIAILIGGAAASYRLEDDLLWTMMTRLDRIRVRVLRDLKGHARGGAVNTTCAKLPRVHPAVDEFLLRNRERMGE